MSAYSNVKNVFEIMIVRLSNLSHVRQSFHHIWLEVDF